MANYQDQINQIEQKLNNPTGKGFQPSAKPKMPKQSADRTVSTPSQLANRQTQAQQAAESTKVALVTNHQERLVKLSSALDRAEQRRDETLERLSDRVAYLQDDNLFMHDLLSRAQQKLQQANQTKPEQTEVTVTVLDSLIDAFDAIGDWDLPALPGISDAKAIAGI